MASVEQDLLNHLRFAGLDKDNLAALVKVVAGFSDKGVLKNFKVFPIGVPPVYEGLEIKSVVSVQELGTIVQALYSHPAVGPIRLFPYGVPQVEFATLEAVIGPSPSVAGVAGGAAG